MGYIYLITNKVDNKKYIGQTLEKDINERWKSHFKKGSNCRYLKHALKKYGKSNFKFDIICICFDKDCDKYEQEYMDKYNTLVPNGYNLRQAGNNGRHNEETKKKISNSVRLNYAKLTPEQKKKYIEKRSGANNPQFGKKRTPEEKEKLRNKKTNRKVDCFNLQNELIATYKTIKDACDATGSNNSSISKCCKGKVKTCKGFIWRYSEN